MKITERKTTFFPHAFQAIPLGVYLLLLAPFLSTIPYLDGNIDFVQSFDFYIGGMQRYFQQWGSVHPPVKLLMSACMYVLFGIHPWDYNLVGLLIGLAGIYAWYSFCTTVGGSRVGRISSLFFATCPLFLASSIFVLRDQMVMVFVIISLYLYQKERYLLSGVVGSLLVLTKETGLLFPMSIIIIEAICLKKTFSLPLAKKASRLWELLPIATFLCWLYYLRINNQKPWSDWLFSPTASKGTFYTVFYNITTGNFLNQFAYQQWLHLFVLNFNWIIWICALTGIMRFLFVHDFARIRLMATSQSGKSVCALILFFFAYLFSVLTIQTYTITRYILPTLPLLFLFASYGISSVNKITRSVLYLLFGLLVFLQLFFSVDPVSLSLWKEITVFDQTLYGVNNSLSGNDGITYNMQYLIIAKKRSDVLKERQTTEQDFSSCSWLLKDPNNDNKTISILNLRSFSYGKACNTSK